MSTAPAASQTARLSSGNQTDLEPLPAPASSHCELDVLKALGWQAAYDLTGYSINTTLPYNCSSQTWQSLGCLHSLTNLTLKGSLPALPGSWGANGSFPALQAMTFASSSLTGALPSSWSGTKAFPELRTLSLNMTQLSGSLPDAWGQPGAFAQLVELYLDQTEITGTGTGSSSCVIPSEL